jgi:pyruvate carboxylase subunit B
VKYTVEIAGTTLDIEVAGGRVLVDGRAHEVRLSGRSGDPRRRLVRGRGSRAFVAASGEVRGEWVLTSGGARLQAQVLDPREAAVRRAGARGGPGPGSGTTKAPMPGLVLRVLVEEGAKVKQGQGLVVVEAMKMENELKAPRDGVVRKVHAAPGDRVEKGTPLVELT